MSSASSYSTTAHVASHRVGRWGVAVLVCAAWLLTAPCVSVSAAPLACMVDIVTPGNGAWLVQAPPHPLTVKALLAADTPGVMLVKIDDKAPVSVLAVPVGEVTEGTFSLNNMSPGAHTLKVWVALSTDPSALVMCQTSSTFTVEGELRDVQLQPPPTDGEATIPVGITHRNRTVSTEAKVTQYAQLQRQLEQWCYEWRASIGFNPPAACDFLLMEQHLLRTNGIELPVRQEPIDLKRPIAGSRSEDFQPASYGTYPLLHQARREALARNDFSSAVLRQNEMQYMHTTKLALTGLLFDDGSVFWAAEAAANMDQSAESREKLRYQGGDWPKLASTMIGMVRLSNLQDIMEAVINNGIQGDFLEAGVWRGGACILMRAYLKMVYDDSRTVWVADSFAGLPKPDAARFPVDEGDDHHVYDHLAVSVEDVKDNFRRFGMLDGRVKFLVGFFEDTIAAAPVDKLAILRLDGDMYSSTWVCLEALYDKVEIGGYVIVDDWGLKGSNAAVIDFRIRHGIVEPLFFIQLGADGAYWRKEHPFVPRP